MTKNIVIKFGGSLLFNEGGTINSQKITDFCNIIKHNKDYDSIIVVCGGGIVARQYIKAIRDFTEYLQFNESDYDAYYYRGVSNLYLKFKNDGVKDLKKALNILLKQNEKPELRKTIESILSNGVDINYSKKFFKDADSDETEPEAAVGD